ncbi:apolipoprotein D-like isoform X2 [Schistocerca serialis cubense]|nr:apolipoprotein D-like isoform X2 [Schistocerca serialis cubense]
MFLPAVVLAAWLAASPAVGQVPGLGPCPDVEVEHNFSVERYLGKWYEQERYFAVFELGGNCVTAEYTDEGNGVVGVNNTMTNLVTGRTQSIKGRARLANNTSDARLVVIFSSVGSFEAPYWILGTDYDNYSVVWSCGSFGDVVNARFSWLLTRAKNPGKDIIRKMRRVLDKNGIPLQPYMRTLQVCPN